MDTRDPVFESYITPFEIVESLGLKSGYEKSFKLVDGQILRNRYLIGIDKSELDDRKLMVISGQMRMPASFVSALTAGLADANLVLLGFEQAANTCTYKIYLEYWDKMRSDLASQTPPYSPQTLFVGYKWNALDGSERALTNYVCYPKISFDEIVRRIRKIGDRHVDLPAFRVALEIVSLAARQSESSQFVYLEASEVDNPRTSFDINLYPAGLDLNAIYPFMSRLCSQFSIATDELDRLYGQAGSALLGHLSAGIGRDGGDFFSVYYEVGAIAA